MPSWYNRLTGLIPGFARQTAPSVNGSAHGATHTAPIVAPGDPPRRPKRTISEKLPHRWGGLNRITFLPFLDSATQDSPEIRTAMRKMLRSPWVKAAWVGQVLQVASQEFQIQPHEADAPDAQRQADFIEYCINRMPMGLAGLVLSITYPLGPDGVSINEKVHEIEQRDKKWAGLVVPAAVKPKDLDTLQLLGDQYRNITIVRSLRRTGSVGSSVPTAADFDARDFLIAQYLPLFNDPYGMAAFRASYAAYWLLDTIAKLRAIHHEKRTAGTLVGTYTDEDHRATLEEALRNLKNTTWAAVPEGVRIEVLALTTANDTDYRSFEQDKQSEIVAGIAGATLHILTGNVTDARGDTKVQQETSELGPWYLSKLVEETVNRQFTPDYIDWNFPAVRGYPRLTLGAVTQEEIQKILATVEAAQRAGYKLSKKHYAKECKLQLADPNEPDDVLEPVNPQQPAGGPGMGGGFGAMPFSEVREFVEWKPYQNPRDGRSGWISDGGQVRYTRPTGRNDVVRDEPAKPEPDIVGRPTYGATVANLSRGDTSDVFTTESYQTKDGGTVHRWIREKDHVAVSRGPWVDSLDAAVIGARAASGTSGPTTPEARPASPSTSPDTEPDPKAALRAMQPGETATVAGHTVTRGRFDPDLVTVVSPDGRRQVTTLDDASRLLGSASTSPQPKPAPLPPEPAPKPRATVPPPPPPAPTPRPDAGQTTPTPAMLPREASSRALTAAGPTKRNVQLGDEKLPKSKAKVHVPSVAVEKQADEMLARIYGGDAKSARASLAASLGMPDDALLIITTAGKYDPLYTDDIPIPGAEGIRVRVDHPAFADCRRFVGIDKDGNRFIKNEIIELKPEFQGGGLGTEIFSRQVESASELGFDEIRTHAAGDAYSTSVYLRRARDAFPGANIEKVGDIKRLPGGPEYLKQHEPPFNGYYTWALLGYNESLERTTWESRQHKMAFEAARRQFPGAKTILDIIDQPGGEEWWSKNGVDLFDARFDLTPGSRSIERLKTYLAQRKKKVEKQMAESIRTSTSTTLRWTPFARRTTSSSASLPATNLHVFADPPPGSAPLRDQVALPGADGMRAVELLRRATDEGTATLARVAEQAVRRLLADPNWPTATTLFDDAELQAVADAVGATVATADLLGRSRIIGLAERAGTRTFADEPFDPFRPFLDSPPSLAPRPAVDYFRRLVPSLELDPMRFGPLLDRHAFTLAHATDQVLLQKIKDAIGLLLQGRAQDAGAGAGISRGPVPTGAEVVQIILDHAGVSQRNPQYAEMVWRTNAMDSYHQGAMAELRRPEMQELFPAWQYLGIRDGRQGTDHEPRFDKFFPNTAAFADVRGPRVWNCRCSFRPVTADELQGRTVEASW